MTSEDQISTETRDRIARQFIEAIPHARALGMSLDRLGSGDAEISMPWNADFVGDPRSGIIHGGAELAGADLGLLQNERELALCARLASFPELVQNAAADYAPHQIAFYLKDLAADFHSWYNAERMLVDDEKLRDARVALAAAVRQVIRNGLAILGVSCPESM